jgi:hypothetical protein
MPFAPAGVTQPERYTPMITNAESLKNLSDLFNANMPSGTQVSFDPFIDGEPMAIDDLMPSVTSSPIDFSFNPFEDILLSGDNIPSTSPTMPEIPDFSDRGESVATSFMPGGEAVASAPIPETINIFGETYPVSIGSGQMKEGSFVGGVARPDLPLPEFGFMNKPATSTYEPIEIDPIPQPVDFPVGPMPSYFIPEAPVKSLQENPTTPVGMPEPVLQEIMQEQDAREELRDIIASKEVLQEMPAQDGIRNEYQMAINDFINESPTNMEVYKTELPVGSAINLGVPSLFENIIAPAVIPGLGIAQSIEQSSNSTPPPPPPSPSFTAPSSGGRFYNDNTRFLLR